MALLIMQVRCLQRVWRGLFCMHDQTRRHRAMHAESCPNRPLASTVNENSSHEPLSQGSILRYSTSDRHAPSSGSLGPDAVTAERPRLWGLHHRHSFAVIGTPCGSLGCSYYKESDYLALCAKPGYPKSLSRKRSM